MYVTLYPVVMSATKLLSSAMRSKHGERERERKNWHIQSLYIHFTHERLFFIPLFLNKFANVTSDRRYYSRSTFCDSLLSLLSLTLLIARDFTVRYLSSDVSVIQLNAQSAVHQ